ncbi:hypothetical protein RCL_jg20751.t1 [Rhizophagus clarus]|uniref:Uncharacterized protein n=1 Tax=Rhizophagus clarus TaxID=94130 RepID=A0A8H3QAN0_9GLOM|nr:hypothetical protein RCL_jg5.t1 [Rhizophagus clarus]GES86838.1 hypothetical protein RCL_jg20751.t1 [Rhizophagus clarus]
MHQLELKEARDKVKSKYSDIAINLSIALTKNQKKKLKKKQKAAEKITFWKKNSHLTASVSSPCSPLVSQASILPEITIFTSHSLLKCQDSSDNKVVTFAIKKLKVKGSTRDNGLIITRYQPDDNEKTILLDLVVYNIPTKWSNYELLIELSK